MEFFLGSSLFFLLPLLLFSFLCPALLFFSKRPFSSPANGCSSLKGYFLMGHLPHLIKNRRRLLEWSAELILASPTGTVTVAPVVFTGNPSNVEHMAKANFGNYPKHGAFISPVRDFLGCGILNVNGEEWRLQRKAASYAFNSTSLRAFVFDKVDREIVGRLFPLMREASQSDEVLDLQDVLERFAFDTICSLVLGEDPGCLGGGHGSEEKEGERFFRAFGDAVHLSVERALQPLPLVWKAKKWLDIGSERRLRESMAIVHGFVDRCMRSRRLRTSGDGGTDFLSRFDQRELNSNELIRDILINFVLAGRDTTPAALTWFFWVLASQPQVANKIREEIELIRSRRAEEDGSRASFTMEELREMNYLQAATSESLRLYPPVPLVPRSCSEEEELPDGARMRKGWVLMYNAYAMGRRDEIWGEDCREFKPERWLEEEEGVFRAKSPFVYPVFHGGPRICMGKDVAYVQMKAIAASILERFEMEVVEASGRHQLLMTMRMEGGLLVKVKERSSGKCAWSASSI
ncbi:unnamed protein product [Musa acuminata subsp. malaccensis]|uniref:(wild Malaysian banana) hypothetical protein n=1 Tax=Musa acuminata subsp. malaccensis TaxID=214687 RepID=A0A804JXC1_MUSAM|nr:PREDICTED: cytochrome P450 94A1-like [Musa acuminata subsp. malaccensis]CAG1857100.1 unnamed protein product [Musa acuminata subsp. malaccensis]